MEKLTEIKLTEKVVYKGPIFNVEKYEVRLPNGKKAIRDVVINPNAVAVIAIDSDNKIAMVRQYRISAGRIMLEIPAGKLDYGEEPLYGALRELKEETGLDCEEIKLLFQINVSPGFSSEVIYIYMAKGLIRGEADPDDDEFLEIDFIKLDTLVKMIYKNKINDAKSVAGILAVNDIINN